MAENASFVSSSSRRFSPRVILSILLLVGLPAWLIGYSHWKVAALMGAAVWAAAVAGGLLLG